MQCLVVSSESSMCPSHRQCCWTSSSHSVEVWRDGYWTTRGYANSRIANSRTGRLADWASRGLVNSRTGQLADATVDFACLVFVLLAACATASCPVRELTSARVDQSARCPVRELAIRKLAYLRVIQLPARLAHVRNQVVSILSSQLTPHGSFSDAVDQMVLDSVTSTTTNCRVISGRYNDSRFAVMTSFDFR